MQKQRIRVQKFDPVFSSRKRRNPANVYRPGIGPWRVMGFRRGGGAVGLGGFPTRDEAERFQVYLETKSEIEGYTRFWVEEWTDREIVGPNPRSPGGRGHKAEIEPELCDRIYRYLIKYHEAYGRWPTILTIANTVQRGKKAVCIHLEELARQGRARKPRHTGEQWSAIDREDQRRQDGSLLGEVRQVGQSGGDL